MRGGKQAQRCFTLQGLPQWAATVPSEGQGASLHFHQVVALGPRAELSRPDGLLVGALNCLVLSCQDKKSSPLAQGHEIAWEPHPKNAPGGVDTPEGPWYLVGGAVGTAEHPVPLTLVPDPVAFIRVTIPEGKDGGDPQVGRARWQHRSRQLL